MENASLFKTLAEAAPLAITGVVGQAGGPPSAVPGAAMGVNPPVAQATAVQATGAQPAPSGGIFGRASAPQAVQSQAAAAQPAQISQPTATPGGTPAPQAELVVAGVAGAAEPKKRTRRAKEASTPEAMPVLVLVDCALDKGLGITLEEFAAPAMQAAASAYGKTNWRLIEYTSRGALEDAFVKQLSVDPLVGPILVSSGSDVAAALMPVFERMDEVMIVRGRR